MSKNDNVRFFSLFFKKIFFYVSRHISVPGRMPGLISSFTGRLGSPLPFPSQGILQPMVDPPADPGRGEGASPLHSFDFKMGVQKMIMSEISVFVEKKHFSVSRHISVPGRILWLISFLTGRLGSPLPFPSQGIPQPTVDPLSDSGGGGIGVAAKFL